MMNSHTTRHQSGVALLEALLAVLILAIGLLGTVGLQARAYSALNDANARAEATIATEKLLGVMSNDVGNISNYALASGDTPSSALQPWVSETQQYIPGAQITVAVTNQARRYQIDIVIQWTAKAASAGGTAPPPSRHAVTSYIGY